MNQYDIRDPWETGRLLCTVRRFVHEKGRLGGQGVEYSGFVHGNGRFRGQ